jgi:lipopolysaccharide/colanic/teichoic acid biosynthesis glycosyltransferase
MALKHSADLLDDQSLKGAVTVASEQSTRQEASSFEAHPWCSSRSKRAADVIVAGLLAPFAIIAVAFTALVAAASFRGWPFFIQDRTGLGGRRIRIIKVRSLPRDWDPTVGKHRLQEDELSAVSHFIRGNHLDELPQFANVFAGSMSLVGPRPMIDDVLELLDDDVRDRRHAVKPGLSGLWQVSTMGSVSLDECPELDLAYVENASRRVDLGILWWTLTRRQFGSEFLLQWVRGHNVK